MIAQPIRTKLVPIMDLVQGDRIVGNTDDGPLTSSTEILEVRPVKGKARVSMATTAGIVTIDVPMMKTVLRVLMDGE